MKNKEEIEKLLSEKQDHLATINEEITAAEQELDKTRKNYEKCLEMNLGKQRKSSSVGTNQELVLKAQSKRDALGGLRAKTEAEISALQEQAHLAEVKDQLSNFMSIDLKQYTEAVRQVRSVTHALSVQIKCLERNVQAVPANAPLNNLYRVLKPLIDTEEFTRRQQERLKVGTISGRVTVPYKVCLRSFIESGKVEPNDSGEYDQSNQEFLQELESELTGLLCDFSRIDLQQLQKTAKDFSQKVRDLVADKGNGFTIIGENNEPRKMGYLDKIEVEKKNKLRLDRQRQMRANKAWANI